MIKQIFIDLDDVLGTSAPHMLRAVGCPVASDDYSIWPIGYGFEIVRVASHILGIEVSWIDFWNNISEDTWITIPKSPFADWLIYTCAALVGRRNVYIATAPIDTPWCASGKMQWMQENLPVWLHRQFLITPCKYLIGNPGSLLIDDYPPNITRFRRRGGRTITVPRPWNHLRGREIVPHIGRQLLRSTK